MIKIERVVGKDVTVTIGGITQRVFPGQWYDNSVLDTLEVGSGSVVYSVNETEIVTVGGRPVPEVPEVPEVLKVLEEEE